MNIQDKQPQTVYVPVSVKERLPEDKTGEIPVISEGGICEAYWQEHRSCILGSRAGAMGAGFVDTYNKLPINVTHWLSPQTAVVLSVEEWEEVKKCIYYQNRVNDWMQKCFGEEISKDKTERNHRFLEEALELVQSIGCTKSEAHQLVDYVFNRPEGEIHQECGGVMITLAALCLANELNMNDCGENELQRVWTKVDKIREKQANKPKHSPLP